MAGTLSLLAIGLLVLFVLVKAHTSKILVQLRHRCNAAIAQERHVRREKERVESRLESNEARLNQLEGDRERLGRELAELTERFEQVNEELRRLKPDDVQESLESDPESSSP